MSKVWSAIVFLSIISCVILQSISVADAVNIKADIALILVNPSTADQNLMSEISSLGYTYDIIKETDVQNTNFSNYRMIIIGDQKLASPQNIPIDKYKTITINSYNYYNNLFGFQLGWSGYAGTKSSPTILKVAKLDSEIVQGLPTQFNAYTTSTTSASTSFLNGKKPTGINIIVYASPLSSDAVIATLDPGRTLLNGKTLQQRNLFFGIAKTNYWTPQSRKLFNNSITWILRGEDLDGDGFYSDLDCNDKDPLINQNGTEIPYDNIDQDCSGADLADVDGDGFCQEGYAIQNSLIQCINEQQAIGIDCQDGDFTINPLNTDPYNNCVNDAPIIQNFPVTFVYNENDTVVITAHATDPENDFISYSINDSRFTTEDNVFTWETTNNDENLYSFLITASDDQLSSNTTVNVRIKNVNILPTSITIPDISWEEDNSAAINLSDYFIDEDGDPLIFGIESTSNDTSITVFSNIYGIFNFTAIQDFFGQDWVIFWASDGLNKTVSNKLKLQVTPVNDAPFLDNPIPNIELLEDAPLQNEINLTDYFKDIDSQPEFTVSVNNNIEVVINGDTAAFSPKENFVGAEEISFIATDGEFSLDSNNITITVIPVNDAPVFSNLTCETTIQEDTESTCNLEATDEENDSISFSVALENNLNCTIEGNILTYIGIQNYNGPASCELKVSDGNDYNTKILDINISNINDVPYLDKEIPNITVNEDTQLKNAINLSDYFKDIDSQLEFTIVGNNHIQAEISNSLLTLTPNPEFVGAEEVYFTATDEEFNIISNTLSINVIEVNDAPVFSNLTCETTIQEDTESTCNLEATDEENDSISFSVALENNLNCTIEGNVLTYIGKKDYSGTAYCTLKVLDQFSGNDTRELNIMITPINDPPQIFSSDPAEDSINILEGKTETFIVNYIDIDSQNINISWFINDFPEPHSPYSTKEIIFDEPQGIYLIQAIISDEQYNIIRSWNVVVGSTKDFTCSEVGGNICQESQACSSSLVEVKDSNLCCATSCMPSFKAANACSIVNDSVKINILNPKQEDNIQLGKTLNIRIEIINDLEKDLDEDVEISLYDLTTDKVIEKQDASIAVDKGGHSSTEYIDLDIPSDIDLDHDYALYTKTIGDICTQSYQNVNLKRPDNNVVLSKFEMPNKAECGDIVNVKLKAENLGGKNQDVSITLKNTELRVNNSTGKFTIEKQGDSDTQNEELSFIIPRNVNTGEYKIKASVDSSTETDTHTRTLQVECNTEEVQQVSIPPQNNTIVLTAVNENQQPIEEPISLLSIGLIASSFILIALMAVLYFVFMSSKRSVPELSANKIQHSTIKPLSKTKKRK